METQEAPATVVCHKEGLENVADIRKSTASNKSSEDVFKCNCTNIPIDSGTPSNTGSVSSTESGSSSNTEPLSSNASSEASFIIVSDSPTHTEQKCCLQQRCWSVFDNERFSDVAFIVGEGECKEKILAHKVILSIGSDVFNTLFSKNWSADATEVEVPDVEPSAFKALLRFLYTDNVSLTSDSVTAILYAARKYAVQPLESRCVDFLMRNLCSDNAFTILNQAMLYDDQKLINSCLDKIDVDTSKAVAADGFSDANAKALRLVLERNTLTVSEVELFAAVLWWCEEECLRKNLPVSQDNKRLVVKDILPLIRFPLMSVYDFSSLVVQSGLLTNEELVSMYQYLTTKPKPPVNFNNTQRLSDHELVVNRFKTTLNEVFECTGDMEDKIDFICDHDMELLGYGLHGALSDVAKYEVQFQLIDTLSNFILGKESSSFFCDGTSETFRVLFPDPLKLTALTKYTAFASIKGPDCCCGEGGLEEVTMDLPLGEKVTITFSTHGNDDFTTVDEGCIPQLIFKV